MIGQVLLDSHVYLWLLYQPESLGARARERIESASGVLVSTVSLWELTIKHRAGRLPYSPSELVDAVDRLGAVELGVHSRHVRSLVDLELPHRDPFDAMLIAQARADGLVLVTADRALLASGYDTLDARA